MTKSNWSDDQVIVAAEGVVSLLENREMLHSAEVVQVLITRFKKLTEPHYGVNGGVRCDVYSGPCACGAWH